MRVPGNLNVLEVQQSFREVWASLDEALLGNRDLEGRKFTNVADAASEREWVTLVQGDRRYAPLVIETEKPKRAEFKAVRIIGV